MASYFNTSEERAVEVSKELFSRGFKHLVMSQVIDPHWKQTYHPEWSESQRVIYRISVDEYLMPMDRVKSLIEACDKLGLSFWMQGHAQDNGDEGWGVRLEVRMEDKK